MSGMSAYKVRIGTHTADSTAIILLANGVLLGVLTELLDGCHGDDRGKWAIEAAFGIDEKAIPATFASASEAANWLGTCVAGASFNFHGQVPELR